MTTPSRLSFSPSLTALVILFLTFYSTSVWGLSSPPIQPTDRFILKVVVSKGLSKPIFLTHAGDTSSRLFVVEQDGRVLIVENGRLQPNPFLDISPKLATGGERGLLGLAFHPKFLQNRRFFVNYTRKRDGATVIAEYQASPSLRRSENKETILLIIPQPYGNHNGGMIAFGQDGFLYIGTGDGGAGGDPGNRGQNPSELLGKILRIDVNRGTPYAIPTDNPFRKKHEQAEIFATGFRNPWRFSFDRITGELWAGDVGQNAWEEIDLVRLGKNYGWRLMEGTHCYEPDQGCGALKGLTNPVTEYSHDRGRCSVTGGYVYRGKKIPTLQGTYLFGDFCTGEIWGYRDRRSKVLADTNLMIASFGEDTDGELYVLGHGGSIHQFTPNPSSAGLKQ